MTLIVALAAVAAFASDGATALLEGSRVAISDGQWWRVFTGHVTHWSGDHLAWDLFMFVVLGVTLEHRNRKRYLALLVASAATISASVFLLQSNIASYRGLSGVDSALFVAVCANLLVDARRDERRTDRHANVPIIVATFLFAGFIGKTIFEYATDDTLFVASNAAGFTPLPLAHVAGAAVAVCLTAYYPLHSHWQNWRKTHPQIAQMFADEGHSPRFLLFCEHLRRLWIVIWLWPPAALRGLLADRRHRHWHDPRNRSIRHHRQHARE